MAASTKAEKRKNFKWCHKEVTNLLELICEKVKDNPESFEKPTSQKFYEAICENETVPKISWVLLKSKMRHLRNTYVKAIQWTNNTGAGLLEVGDGKSVSEYLKKICPFYEQLDDVFGRRKHVNVPVVVCSTDSLKALECDTELYHQDFSVEYLDDATNDVTNSSICTDLQSTSYDINGPQTTNESVELLEDVQTPSSSNLSGISFGVLKTTNKKKTVSNNPLATMLEIQTQKLELERSKFEWQQEKEKQEMQAKNTELQNRLLIRQMELEMDERLKKNAQQLEAENDLKKFEMELKYKYNK